jgi:uncharacterized protein (TIGR02996 family)
VPAPGELLDRVRLRLVERPVAATSPRHDTSALVSEIVAHPDDDRPRMVLADLLTERGDPHGELITIQLRLASLPRWERDLRDPALAAERAELAAREKAILDAHGERIAGEVAERATAYTFRRGFVDEVTMAAPTFARHGERLFSQHPISSLALRPLNEGAIAKLAATPALARVRRLRFRQEIGAEREIALAPLGRSPHLASLVELVCHNHRTTDADWEATFEALRAPKLARVRLIGGRMSAIYGLARNPHLSSLREIVFESGTDGVRDSGDSVDRALEALAASQLATLETLELEDTFVGRDALLRLFDGTAAFRLREFRDEPNACDALAEILVASPGAAELRRVDVSRARMTDAGYALLFRLPRLERITSYANDLTDEQAARVVEALRALPASHPLREVGISRVTSPPDLAGRFTAPD